MSELVYWREVFDHVNDLKMLEPEYYFILGGLVTNVSVTDVTFVYFLPLSKPATIYH